MQGTGETKAPRTFPVGDVGKEPLPPTFSFLSFYGLSEQPFDVTPTQRTSTSVRCTVRLCSPSHKAYRTFGDSWPSSRNPEWAKRRY